MKDMYFQQLFEPSSSTYTYLLADPEAREAVVIDPVLETVDRDAQLLSELGFRLKYLLETHVHADHVTGSGELRSRMGGQIAMSHNSGAQGYDVGLKDGDEIPFGRFSLRVIATPGHTDGCLSYYGHGRVFTGDALLIRGCGRTDFQQGSSETLFASVTQKLFALPEETMVFPGHDYRGFSSSTIGHEKKYNPRLGQARSLAEFKKIMSELKLAYPKKIDVALPANLRCGLKSNGIFHPQDVGGIPEVSAEDVQLHLGKGFRLIDVRRPEEFTGELGHIPGAELVTLGPELMEWLENGPRDAEIVFVCRSGGRSGQATAVSQQFGYQKSMNMTGGMLRWNELGYKTSVSD